MGILHTISVRLIPFWADALGQCIGLMLFRGGNSMANLPNFVDGQVGVRVRSLREAAGISVQNAAVLISCSSEHYQELEAGTKRFQPRQLTALADEFGVHVSEIFAVIEIPWMDQLCCSTAESGAPLH